MTSEKIHVETHADTEQMNLNELDEKRKSQNVIFKYLFFLSIFWLFTCFFHAYFGIFAWLPVSGLGIFFVYSVYSYSDNRKQIIYDLRIKRSAINEKDKIEKSKVKEIILSAFNCDYFSETKISGRDCWLFLDAKGLILKLVTFKVRNLIDDPLVKNETDIDLAHLRQIDFIHEDKTRIIEVNRVTPVTVQKSKSPVVRGLVGAAILGPVGLVLGAASGLTPKSEIIEHVSTSTKQISYKGPPSIVLILNDLENPSHKLEFSDVEIAKDWLYRLESLVNN